MSFYVLKKNDKMQVAGLNFWLVYIQISVITRCIIKELYSQYCIVLYFVLLIILSGSAPITIQSVIL